MLSVVALMLFSTAGVLAQTKHHDTSKMDMSAMMAEPHHALAMAYKQNIGTFAKVLHDQAMGSTPLDAGFAREAVAEMKRSLDQMEAHHAEHMGTMSEEMRSHMATMMKDMEAHGTMLKNAVNALEQDVKADHLDSKRIAADSASVLEHLDAMSKMHADKKGTMKM
jgi:hypothetical protein